MKISRGYRDFQNFSSSYFIDFSNRHAPVDVILDTWYMTQASPLSIFLT